MLGPPKANFFRKACYSRPLLSTMIDDAIDDDDTVTMILPMPLD